MEQLLRRFRSKNDLYKYLNEAVQGRARAFPAYPATFAYAQTNMFRGRMIASPWKGNRTIRALVETCLDHAKQELAPELLAKLEAAEEAHAEKQAVWKADTRCITLE